MQHHLTRSNASCRCEIQNAQLHVGQRPLCITTVCFRDCGLSPGLLLFHFSVGISFDLTVQRLSSFVTLYLAFKGCTDQSNKAGLTIRRLSFAQQKLYIQI